MEDGADRRREQGQARQLVLDLAHRPSYDRDEFLVSPSNAVAHATIERWPDWPGRVLLLLGPPGSGKSHLGAIWAAKAGARVITPGGATPLSAWVGPVVALVEDCGRSAYNQATLFHLINMVGETGGWLLVTSTSGPTTWGITVPDLLSRFRLATSVELQSPDAELIKAVIVKLFADRQIRIDEDVVNYAALHCEQSLQAIGTFVAAVDEDALASGRRITRPLAAQALARLASDAPDGR